MSHPVLIADSGASKTDWRLIHSKDDIRSFRTDGFNPFFIGTPNIQSEVDKELVPFLDSHAVKEVYFYGAGCSSTDRIVIVEDALIPLFPCARVNVENDLLGAARALCGHHEGIACILGTGSNSCLYDGVKIIENIPSLGFMLGDEGSAAHIGKQILIEVLTKIAPAEIIDLFQKKYGYDRSEILTHLYQKPFPNQFLATFAMFATENAQHDFFRRLVKRCFREFFKMQLMRYSACKDVQIFFTGSVSAVFSEILKEVAEENEISIKEIAKSPIDGLVRFHLDEMKKHAAAKYTSDDR